LAPLGLKGKGGALLGIFGIRRNQAYSGVIFDGSCDFYAEFIANRGAVRRLPGEGIYLPEDERIILIDRAYFIVYSISRSMKCQIS